MASSLSCNLLFLKTFNQQMENTEANAQQIHFFFKLLTKMLRTYCRDYIIYKLVKARSWHLRCYLWYLCGFSFQSADTQVPSGSLWGLWQSVFHPAHLVPTRGEDKLGYIYSVKGLNAQLQFFSQIQLFYVDVSYSCL